MITPVPYSSTYWYEPQMIQHVFTGTHSAKAHVRGYDERILCFYRTMRVVTAEAFKPRKVRRKFSEAAESRLIDVSKCQIRAVARPTAVVERS